MILNGTAAERFWSKVDKSGECWLWTARRDRHGYGKFRPNGANGSEVGAHRVSYVLAGGVLSPGQLVLHHCDVPACIRPDHLYAGTAAQNTADMDRRGRRKNGNTTETASRGEAWRAAHSAPGSFVIAERGEANRSAKLTADKVRTIRALAASGRTHESLGAEFGVSQVHVSRIVARKNWAHV